MKNIAGKVVSDALLGLDYKNVWIGGKPFTIKPPTIHKMIGAYNALIDVETDLEEKTPPQLLWWLGHNSKAFARSLSFLIDDSDKLTDDLSAGTFNELLSALFVAFDMVRPNFGIAASLLKSVSNLAATTDTKRSETTRYSDKLQLLSKLCTSPTMRSLTKSHTVTSV